MPTATKSDKIDLSSEKKTEELASKLLKKLKPGDTVFFLWRNRCWKDYFN